MLEIDNLLRSFEVDHVYLIHEYLREIIRDSDEYRQILKVSNVLEVWEKI